VFAFLVYEVVVDCYYGALHCGVAYFVRFDCLLLFVMVFMVVVLFVGVWLSWVLCNSVG